MPKKKRIPHKFQPWIDARKKYLLSHAQIQMARELGFSPKRFGSMSKTKDQPWKLPLAEFIESQYEKRFGKTEPDEVLTMEEIAARHVERRAARKAANKEAEGRAKAAARREAKLEEQGDTAESATESSPSESISDVSLDEMQAAVNASDEAAGLSNSVPSDATDDTPLVESNPSSDTLDSSNATE